MENIKSIWIEAEQCETEREFENENTDVFVEFENNEKYCATLFTYKNIEELRKKNQKNGECFNGKYFFAAEMLLVDNTGRENIENIINYLLKEGDFLSIFKKV